jgi:SAM-dependent methyltransferase
VSTLSSRRGEQLNDRAKTLRNRGRLEMNRNLLFWYRELYHDQFKTLSHPEELSILEIGSGTSPLKRFHSNVVTSDILELDYLDLVFDCHEIDKLAVIEDNSLDVITLTNVLHHLESPIAFLNSAAAKLKPGGKVFATEPYFSVLSSFIFKYLHHEPVDFRIFEPELDEAGGPLASANIALPWLIFCCRRDWVVRLNENYSMATFSVRPFTALSYMMTGGISRTFPIPGPLYRAIFPVDLALSRYFPRLCASFFTLTLTRR